MLAKAERPLGVPRSRPADATHTEESASIRRSVWHDPGFTELPNARVHP